jgi:hypothetical protein
VEATYGTDTIHNDMISRKGMEDMNGPLDPLHEVSIVTWRGTQRPGLLLNDVEDGVNRLTGDELVKDLMLDQVGPGSLLEFIESGFKEISQLWRGMGRHGDEDTCLFVRDRWEDGLPISAQIHEAQCTAQGMIPSWDDRRAGL